LLPALRLEHKRLVGWLFAGGIAIGTSDVVDTFSHLHTPLVASLLRVVNGAVLGIIVGAVAIAVYRLVDRRAQLALDRRRARAA
jgi:H+/Cl- antiporter ClcA